MIQSVLKLSHSANTYHLMKKCQEMLTELIFGMHLIKFWGALLFPGTLGVKHWSTVIKNTSTRAKFCHCYYY